MTEPELAAGGRGELEDDDEDDDEGPLWLPYQLVLVSEAPVYVRYSSLSSSLWS